jgi:hypothetical protein
MAVVDSRVRYGSLTIGGVVFSCQPTSAAIEPSNDTAGGEDSVEVLCGDTLSAASSATLTANLALTAIQDFTSPDDSLVGHSWAFNGETQDFLWNPTNDPQDEWSGKVTVQAINVGGEVNTRLTSDAAWPITELTMPDRLGGKKVIGASTPATGAVAGTPGAWTPAGSVSPADAAGATASAVVASPTTAWTTGQYMQGTTAGTGGEMHWSGTAWVAGKAA